MLKSLFFHFCFNCNSKYFCFRVTKARQWKRPVRDPINIPASSQNEDEDRDDTDALPAGWKELIDKKTGRAYYVNR